MMNETALRGDGVLAPSWALLLLLLLLAIMPALQPRFLEGVRRLLRGSMTAAHTQTESELPDQRGPKRPHKHNPILGGCQKSCFVGSLCLCGLSGA